jgi:hypothetical protein
MSQPINRERVLADARRIEELSKATILATTPGDNDAAQLGCAILGFIFDGYSAVVRLLGTAGEYHTPMIVRTMFEAFADLRALVNDDAYAQRMMLRAANERKRVVEAYVASYEGKPEFEATTRRAQADLAGLEQKIKDLRDAGIGDYRVSERFQFAGLEDDSARSSGRIALSCLSRRVLLAGVHLRRVERFGNVAGVRHLARLFVRRHADCRRADDRLLGSALRHPPQGKATGDVVTCGHAEPAAFVVFRSLSRAGRVRIA